VRARTTTTSGSSLVKQALVKTAKGRNDLPEGYMKMDNERIWVRSMLFLVVILFFAVSAIDAAELKPRYGGTFRLSDIYDGVSIGFPPKILKIYSFRQAAPAVETLFRTDKTGRPLPWLATGSKEDAKAKTITLTLRKGVKFHDGTDFDAESVKWNLEQAIAAKSMGSEKFKSVDVVDKFTVRINLTEWDNTVTTNLSQYLGMIISPTACKKNGEELCAKQPVGTGPFEFVSWEKDTRTVYRKFPGYWQKGKPYVDRIELTPIIDPLTREMSLKAGQIDLMVTLASHGLSALEKEGYVVTRQRAGSGAMGLVMDSRNTKSPFSDLRVRQAAQYAIDPAAIVKAVFSGENEATNQYTYKGHWAYNPDIKGNPYDPAKAKKLLTEAGYPNGFKTKIVFLTSPENDKLVTAVQGYFKAVGIDAELELVQTARIGQIVYGGTWEGLLYGQVSPSPDVTVPLARLYSGVAGVYSQMQIPADYRQAIENAVTAPEFKTKQKWTKEALKLMIDKHSLIIPLYSMSEFNAARKGVHDHGFDTTPNTAVWTPEDVWLEQ
jgi:peptide/nickel transport system substrate-binding protein